jgi:hypothetical protein
VTDPSAARRKVLTFGRILHHVDMTAGVRRRVDRRLRRPQRARLRRGMVLFEKTVKGILFGSADP